MGNVVTGTDVADALSTFQAAGLDLPSPPDLRGCAVSEGHGCAR